MRDITLHNVRVSGGGKIPFDGYASNYRIGVSLNDVLLTDAGAYTYSIHHTDFVLGPGPVNLNLTGGVDSTLQGTPAKGAPGSCADKFMPFPQNTE